MTHCRAAPCKFSRRVRQISKDTYKVTGLIVLGDKMSVRVNNKGEVTHRLDVLTGEDFGSHGRWWYWLAEEM